MAASAPRLASVSVDLDPVSCYYRIFGLGPHPPAIADVVFRRGLPRFLEVLAAHQLRATFFVVGQDIAGSSAIALAARASLREVIAAGHEVGNHTLTHPYELARLPRARIADEIARGHDEIAAATGVAPVGFRAPGYAMAPAILEELEERGYRYDSSAFAAPAYYAAKAAVMGGLRLLGRPSGAVLADPRTLLAPAEPYRPDPAAPWRRGHARLIELPIAVTPLLRIPIIGLSLALAPARLRAYLLRSMRGRALLNLGLHGLDLLDADLDGVPTELVSRQPDLALSAEAKRMALTTTLDGLGLDYRFVPLREAAEALAAGL